jgi:hypothetical protein
VVDVGELLDMIPKDKEFIGELMKMYQSHKSTGFFDQESSDTENPYKRFINASNFPTLDYSELNPVIQSLASNRIVPGCIKVAQFEDALDSMVQQLLEQEDIQEVVPTDFYAKTMDLSKITNPSPTPVEAPFNMGSLATYFSGFADSVGQTVIFFLLRNFVYDVYQLTPSKIFHSSDDEVKGHLMELLHMFVHAMIILKVNLSGKISSTATTLKEQINEMLEKINVIRPYKPKAKFIILILQVMSYIDTSPFSMESSGTTDSDSEDSGPTDSGPEGESSSE